MKGGLRIASGQLRGRKIEAPPGAATRPLLTRLRKSLVDILRPRLDGTNLLDLFGGSGAIAFELLSNGAASAVISELDAATAALIARNAQQLGLADRVRVLTADARDAIRRLQQEGARFDLVLICPPYGSGLYEPCVRDLAASELVNTDGELVVQCDRAEPPVVEPAGWAVPRIRRYGRTRFEFLARAPRSP